MPHPLEAPPLPPAPPVPRAFGLAGLWTSVPWVLVLLLAFLLCAGKLPGALAAAMLLPSEPQLQAESVSAGHSEGAWDSGPGPEGHASLSGLSGLT